MQPSNATVVATASRSGDVGRSLGADAGRRLRRRARTSRRRRGLHPAPERHAPGVDRTCCGRRQTRPLREAARRRSGHGHRHGRRLPHGRRPARRSLDDSVRPAVGHHDRTAPQRSDRRRRVAVPPLHVHHRPGCRRQLPVGSEPGRRGAARRRDLHARHGRRALGDELRDRLGAAVPDPARCRRHDRRRTSPGPATGRPGSAARSSTRNANRPRSTAPTPCCCSSVPHSRVATNSTTSSFAAALQRACPTSGSNGTDRRPGCSPSRRIRDADPRLVEQFSVAPGDPYQGMVEAFAERRLRASRNGHGPSSVPSSCSNCSNASLDSETPPMPDHITPTHERHAIPSGVELHVLRWEPPTDVGATQRSWLLTHGLASNARLWDGVAHRLAAAGHRVVTVDQRGHGAVVEARRRLRRPELRRRPGAADRRPRPRPACGRRTVVGRQRRARTRVTAIRTSSIRWPASTAASSTCARSSRSGRTVPRPSLRRASPGPRSTRCAAGSNDPPRTGPRRAGPGRWPTSRCAATARSHRGSPSNAISACCAGCGSTRRRRSTPTCTCRRC